jgi:hypothetical protein
VRVVESERSTLSPNSAAVDEDTAPMRESGRLAIAAAGLDRSIARNASEWKASLSLAFRATVRNTPIKALPQRQ